MGRAWVCIWKLPCRKLFSGVPSALLVCLGSAVPAGCPAGLRDMDVSQGWGDAHGWQWKQQRGKGGPKSCSFAWLWMRISAKIQL